jgi:hypothetical protein
VCHERALSVVVEPHQDGGLDLEQAAQLNGDRVEDLGRVGALRDQIRHPPQRGLLFPARVLGDILQGRVDQPAAKVEQGGPLQPAFGTVPAQPPVLGAELLAAAQQLPRRRDHPGYVGRVNVVADSPPGQFPARIAERLLEPRARVFEVSAGADDTEKLKREVEHGRSPGPS